MTVITTTTTKAQKDVQQYGNNQLQESHQEQTWQQPAAQKQDKCANKKQQYHGHKPSQIAGLLAASL